MGHAFVFGAPSQAAVAGIDGHQALIAAGGLDIDETALDHGRGSGLPGDDPAAVKAQEVLLPNHRASRGVEPVELEPRGQHVNRPAVHGRCAAGTITTPGSTVVIGILDRRRPQLGARGGVQGHTHLHVHAANRAAYHRIGPAAADRKTPERAGQ